VVFDYTIQRRTSAQVKADEAKVKAAAAAAEAAAAADKQSQLDRVAALEDAIQEEDAQSLDVIRPDLYIDPKSANTASDADTLSDSHLMPDDPTGIPQDSDPLIDLQPDPLTDLLTEQSSYRGSSHSEDFLTGWKETGEDAAGEDAAAIVDENEHEEQDYLMQSDSEASHVSQASQDQTRKRRPKAKAKKPQYKVSLLS
jgi:hypothetical protein